MKKILLIMVMVLFGYSAHSVLANSHTPIDVLHQLEQLRDSNKDLSNSNNQTPESIIQEVNNEVQIKELEKQFKEFTQLEQLQAQRQSAQERVTSYQSNVTTAQEEIDKLKQQRQAEDSSEAKAELDTRIKAQEAIIKSNTTDLETTSTNVSKFDRQIEENPEYKINKLNERYEALIASTRQRGDEIDKKISQCTSDCEILEILELQKKANEALENYQISRQNNEACQIRPQFCGENINEFYVIQEENAKKVRKLLAELTKLETKKNTERTFEVSGIFTPTGNKGKTLTVQDVVDTIADWLITLVSSIAVTALIIGGFIMIISGGDETRLELGKTIFTYSLIGLLVTLLSFGIITFIQSLFYSDDIAIEETEDVPPATTPSVTTPSSTSPPATTTPPATPATPAPAGP